jgi:catechol 2,3-dioxygenase-like lactoylglutathione lyase family enzyme
VTNPTPPQIDCERLHPTLSVRDVPAAVDFYITRLGYTLGFLWGDPPGFAGVTLGQVQLFLPQGAPNPAGCEVNFVVGDADELFAFHRATGVEVVVPPGDREYGLRDFSVRGLDGYELGFGHYLYTAGPPPPLERVGVPVRLEKRLAALLADLAAHNRMSLDSCLEEILLHTCEPLGDGVASPHTQSQLRHIQDRKRQHGIDYDCRASDRFVERRPGHRGPPCSPRD